MVKSRSSIADFAPLGRSMFGNVDGIADVEARERDVDLLGDFGRVADQLEIVADDVEDAAALDAGRFFFVGEAHGDVDVDLAMFADAQEIDVDRTARHGMELDVLGQRAMLSCRSASIITTVFMKWPVESILARSFSSTWTDMRFLLVAVDHGGDPAIATQFTGGSLASPFACSAGSVSCSLILLFLRVNAPPRLQG